MEAKRENRAASNSLVTNLFPVDTPLQAVVTVPENCTQAQLVLPLDGGTFTELTIKENKAEIILPKDCFYFMIICS